MPTTKKKDELENQQNQTATQQSTPAQSSAVQQAQNTLMQLSGRNYQSQWQPQINSMMDQYLNRDKFSYDLNADALYNQLRDQYALMGQQAMMDTMGQATALTGGYGNSYAQSVGQQAYQGYMQQLSDKAPDLYQMALDQYMNEGDQMLENMSVMMQQDSIDYGRYRDQLADQDAAFEKLLVLMTEYGYEPTEAELAYAGLTDAQYRAIMGLPDPNAVSIGGGGGSSSRKSGGSYSSSIAAEQQALRDAGYDIVVDGIDGPQTQAAREANEANNNNNNGYYEQLLGAVSTAKGASNKNTSASTYQESKAAINDAYASGKITAAQKNELLTVATRNPR